MQSYEFEVKCKNALIKALKEKYNEDYTIQELHMVWFARVLRNFKCVICDLKPNQRIYECTYNGEKDELYVDIYDKWSFVTKNSLRCVRSGTEELLNSRPLVRERPITSSCVQ